MIGVHMDCFSGLMAVTYPEGSFELILQGEELHQAVLGVQSWGFSRVIQVEEWILRLEKSTVVPDGRTLPFH